MPVILFIFILDDISPLCEVTGLLYALHNNKE